VVWARRNVVSIGCPKSTITAQSLYFLEQYAMWKQFGSVNAGELEAKTADALLVLEQAQMEEEKDGEI
jgi:hypothetical protein